MSKSITDETSNAVGNAAKNAKRRPGRPRIHENDAARKRAFNQRRAEAHARARAAERRAARWKDKADEFEEHFRLARERIQTLERLNADREARLLPRIDRLEEQLAHAVRRKEWALEGKDRAVAESRELREELRRAWRKLQIRAANSGLGPLALRVRD
jgi:hypothetical protein